MDLALLAQGVTSFLAPFLPYLFQAGEKAAEEASEKLGEKAWNMAKRLWDKLCLKVEAKPTAQEAAQDVANAPEDADAQSALRLQLKKVLTDDDALAAEVSRLWEEAKVAGVTIMAAGERSVALGGDVSRSTIITGDRNVVGDSSASKGEQG